MQSRKTLKFLVLSVLIVFIFTGWIGVQQTYAQDATQVDTVIVSLPATPINLKEVKKSMPYPLAWQTNGIKGKVIVKVLVGEDGTPVKHEIVKSAHKKLTESVEKSLYNLKFNPAYDQANVPIKMWVTIPIDFNPTY